MKKILWIVVAGWLIQLSGAESIDDQIAKIQNAPAHERVEMMNRLKLQIAAMNEAERGEALNALQQKSSHKMNQFRYQHRRDGSGGEFRQRMMNSPSGGANRQQGRQ